MTTKRIERPNRLQDERGIAMIVALVVSLVVVMLGIVSVTLAVHNSEQSSYDRRRVQAIAAAEAGVNWYFSHLQAVPAAEYACSAQRDLPTTPTTRFAARVTFYNAAGTAFPCPAGSLLGSGPGLPARALIESVGTVTSNPMPARTVQAYVEITSVGVGAFAGVSIYSETGLSLPSNVKVFGRSGNDGNLYTNGNVSLKGNDVISGDVTARGTVTLENVAQVKRHVVANGAISMKSGTTVLGNATSSASSITVQQNKLAIVGDARAGTAITAPGSAIGGLRVANSPSTFPGRTFPAFEYVESAWISQGYSISTFTSCPEAKAFIQGAAPTPGTKSVVRILADCDLIWSGDAPVLRGDLAIISDGSMTVSNNSPWGGDGLLHNLHLVFGFDGDGAPCNIKLGNNSTIDPGLLVMFHTPCTADVSGALILEGQIIAGTVLLKSGATLTHRDLAIPGMGGGAPAEDIVYIREIATTG